jgi:hypothetical protein
MHELLCLIPSAAKRKKERKKEVKVIQLGMMTQMCDSSYLEVEVGELKSEACQGKSMSPYERQTKGKVIVGHGSSG